MGSPLAEVEQKYIYDQQTYKWWPNSIRGVRECQSSSQPVEL